LGRPTCGSDLDAAATYNLQVIAPAATGKAGNVGPRNTDRQDLYAALLLLVCAAALTRRVAAGSR
jgi:hypothetical protein